MDQKTEFLETLKPLLHAIEELKQGNLLKPTGALYNTVLVKCIDLLKENNYIVTKSALGNSTVTNTRELVNHYYNMLRFKTGGKVKPYILLTADLAAAKRLLTTISESMDYDYTASLNFASKMIIVLFDIQDQLDISSTVLCTFRGVFGQDKLSWITERLIRYINEDSIQFEQACRTADADTEKYIGLKNPSFGWDDLDELIHN